MGRGILEGLGIDIEIRDGDIAARGNFCTVDKAGNLLDRRAGRIKSEYSMPLCDELDTIEIPGMEVRIFPVQDYRFVALFRGEGLDQNITETDPQITGVPPRSVQALNQNAQKTAAAANLLIEKAQQLLSHRDVANMISL